ncbi:unnamed protein product [Onchocerca ochengi]|uniref:Secreted protein n=1 Tax=Onchocerca ochengi TaxID=42157 RepID=A0A182EE20_ONCOC|nr:unnamed protein product [Onchocerca ochengi]
MLVVARKSCACEMWALRLVDSKLKNETETVGTGQTSTSMRTRNQQELACIQCTSNASLSLPPQLASHLLPLLQHCASMTRLDAHSYLLSSIR